MYIPSPPNRRQNVSFPCDYTVRMKYAPYCFRFTFEIHVQMVRIQLKKEVLWSKYGDNTIR